MQRTAVVLLGGLGTRVAHLTRFDLPKAMLPVDGRPFIDLKLAELTAMGFTDAVLLTGRGGDALRAHVADGPPVAGLRVECRDDGDRLLGTGGAVRATLERLPERFWVTYGDSLAPVDVEAGEARFDGSVLGVMAVLENDDRWEPSNVAVRDGLVVEYRKGAPAGTYRYVDHGMLCFDRAAFDDQQRETFDLAEVIDTLVERGQLAALVATERFHDVGTEERWRETDAWARETRAWARLTEPGGPR